GLIVFVIEMFEGTLSNVPILELMTIERFIIKNLRSTNINGTYFLRFTIYFFKNKYSIHRIWRYCVLQVKSLEECNKKFRTLPTLIAFVISDSIKRVLNGNYHQ